MDAWRLLRAITFGFVLMTVGVTLLGLAPSLGWVIGATLLRGVGTGALWVFSSAILQCKWSTTAFAAVCLRFEFAALTLDAVDRHDSGRPRVDRLGTGCAGGAARRMGVASACVAGLRSARAGASGAGLTVTSARVKLESGNRLPRRIGGSIRLVDMYTWRLAGISAR